MIQYSSKTHPDKICYHCHVPLCNDLLHDLPQRKGFISCEYRDIIVPVAFCIFSNPELKCKAEDAMGANWNTQEDFGSWLSGKPKEGQKSNGTCLLLWYHQTYNV